MHLARTVLLVFDEMTLDPEPQAEATRFAELAMETLSALPEEQHDSQSRMSIAQASWGIRLQLRWGTKKFMDVTAIHELPAMSSEEEVLNREQDG